MINIAVVDGHPLLQEGIRKVVEKTSDMVVACVAADWKELYAFLEECVPDIVILEINLPGRNGLDVLKDLRHIYTHLPVLVLSIYAEERYAIRALEAGAMGYLNKASISEDLVKAIRTILAEKKKYITPKVAELLSDQLGTNGNGKLHETLSDREFEVLCEIARGKTVNDIAEELSLSVQTVYTYRSNIKEKLDLESNVAMVRYALDHKLIG